jgi:predicted nucleic acid-binding protein
MDELARLFIDTSYVLGLYNKGDQYYNICTEAYTFSQKAKELFITDAVLMEIGNAFSSIDRRIQGAEIIRDFLKSKHVTVVHLSPEYFEQSLQFYEQRTDKEWGLIDCFSIIVMQKCKLEACLTVDHHSRQAGFKILPF